MGGLPTDPVSLMSVGIAAMMILGCVFGCLYYTIWVRCLEPQWRSIRENYLSPCWLYTRRRVIRPCRSGTEGCLTSM